MSTVIQKFVSRRVFKYTQKIILQGIQTGSIETTVEVSLNVPKYILNSSERVKAQVMKYVREAVESKNRPHIQYVQATHLSAPIDASPNTRLGKVNLTIKYLGMRNEFLETDTFYFIKNLRKAFREIYKIHSK